MPRLRRLMLALLSASTGSPAPASGPPHIVVILGSVDLLRLVLLGLRTFSDVDGRLVDNTGPAPRIRQAPLAGMVRASAAPACRAAARPAWIVHGSPARASSVGGRSTTKVGSG